MDAQLDAAITTALDTAEQIDPDEMVYAPDIVLETDPMPVMDDHDEAGNPRPWAQQADESARAYALFQKYLSQPRSGRTQAAVARHYDLNSSSVSSLASKYEWTRRARAWDEERDRIYQAGVIERMREMGERHGDKLERAIEALSLPLEVMADRIKTNPEAVRAELDEKSITQLHALAIKSARALPNMMQTERLARGLPTEITQNIHSGTVEHVHTPDLSEVATILQGLHDAGAIQFDGGRVIDIGEITDAETEPVHPDEADAETDGLPPSQ